jgi:Reverse transcriptase (RNA-dependent DNA polymerase)
MSPTMTTQRTEELTLPKNNLSTNPFYSLDPEPSPPDPFFEPQQSPSRRQVPFQEATQEPEPQSFAPIPQRRSFRARKPPQRLGYDGSQGKGYLSASMAPPESWNWLMCEFGANTSKSSINRNPTYLNPNQPLTLALKASPTDPDTLSFDEAMAEEPEQVKEWLKAASAEIASLEKNATWSVVDKSEATSKILPGTWVFRRKRTPDGSISKYKARYCVRGDLEDDSGQEKFAPVVAWSTVRLFLTLSLTLKWETCTIDFSSAFVQAPLSEPVWIHLPRGFQSSASSKRDSTTCLRLQKSLYGLSVAPRLWYQHLLKALTSFGFRQCANDPCLLYTSSMLIVVYVDDLGIAYSDPNDLDKLFEALDAQKLSFTKEGSFTDFLGIKFERDEMTGTLTLTQKGLINKILEAAQMSDCKPNWTPTTLTALGTDPDGPPMTDPWNYRSIIGMLLYLSTNTRPDITFAVSQAARFSHCPKQSHATAVKTILRYLKRTFDRGMIIKPTGTLDMHTYVDADFAGLHGCEPDYAPASAKSRTGYIVFMGNCPIIWKSQLQTEITLSTLEAEYSALSSSLRSVLPLRSLLAEVIAGIKLPAEIPTTMSCRVFEDNNGALLLATQHKITNRTKYFRVKWHHFWQHVRDRTIDIQKVCTTEQRADYLTKGLPRESFEKIRALVQGW